MVTEQRVSVSACRSCIWQIGSPPGMSNAQKLSTHVGKCTAGDDEVDQCADPVKRPKLFVQDFDLILNLRALLAEVLEIIPSGSSWVTQ